MSLEKLARMVANGFEKTATKEEVATREELITQVGGLRKEMLERFKIVDDRFKAVDERFNDMKLHISSLGSDWRDRFDALEVRVRRLEQKSRA